MTLPLRIGRRTFLRASGLLTLAQLRVLPPAADAAAAAGAVRVLRSREARVLGAIAERITFTGDPHMPRFGETAGLATMDATLSQLPLDIRRQLSWALLLFEYGPALVIGKLSTFSGFSPEWQDVYLMAWADSRFQTCRVAFQAFKNLSMMSYYSQDATWPGIHYQGPWVPRPRRLVG